MLILAAAAPTVGAPTVARGAEPSTQSLAREIVAIADLPGQIAAISRATGQPAPDGVERASEAMSQALAQTYTEEELTALRDFYRTEVGRRVLSKSADYALAVAAAWRSALLEDRP